MSNQNNKLCMHVKKASFKKTLKKGAIELRKCKLDKMSQHWVLKDNGIWFKGDDQAGTSGKYCVPFDKGQKVRTRNCGYSILG